MLLVAWLSTSIACGDDDGPTSVGETGSGGSEGSSAETTASTTTSTTASTTTSTSSMETSGSSGATESTGTTADTVDTIDTSPVACGDAMCVSGEVCVLPCCGGPKPGCSDFEGSCHGDVPPIPPDQCSGGCSTRMCCPPESCTADPPYCASVADLSCDPGGTSCSVAGCYGDLIEDTLGCSCK